MKTTAYIIAALSMLALNACKDKAATENAAPAASAAATSALQGYFGTVEGKEQAKDIKDARKTAAGETVTVRGRLVGAEDIFANGQAFFKIGDPSFVIAEMQEEKPYTACCTPQDIKTANMLTIQLADKEGMVIEQSVKGVNGLKELDYVVVSGKMAPDSTETAPVLNAEKIEIVKAWATNAPKDGKCDCGHDHKDGEHTDADHDHAEHDHAAEKPAAQ